MPVSKRTNIDLTASGRSGYSPDLPKDGESMAITQEACRDLVEEWNRQADKRAAVEHTELAEEVRLRTQRIVKSLRAAEGRASELVAQLVDMEQPSLSIVSAIEDLDEEVQGFYHDLYSLVASALNWRYTVQEVESWYQMANEIGTRRTRLGVELLNDLLWVRKVPTAPFRAKLLRLVAAGDTVEEIERRYVEVSGHSETDLERVVGLKKRSNESVSLFVSYEVAVDLARSLYMSPTEAGV